MFERAATATMAVMKSCLLVALSFLFLGASAGAQPAGRFGADPVFAPGAATVRVPVTGLADAFTVEVWVNPTSYTWTDFLRQLTDPQGSSLVFSMSMTRTGTIYFGTYLGGTWFPIFTVPAVPLDKWTHVAVTYDGARICIYFNAREVGRRNAGGNVFSTSEPLEIGGGFPGRIDEVRVQSRALTPEEIARDRVTPIDPLAPLQVSVTTPEHQSLGVATMPISATFSAPIDPSALTFELLDPAGVPVPATVAYDAARRTATLAPATPLAALTDYVARVASPALAGAMVWTFRTAAPEADPRVALAFTEAAGVTVVDSSGNGNAASLANGAAWS